METAERHSAIIAARMCGERYKEIGKRYGANPQYARRIFENYKHMVKSRLPENTPPPELVRLIGKDVVHIIAHFFGVKMGHVTREHVLMAVIQKNDLYLKTHITQEQVGRLLSASEKLP